MSAEPQGRRAEAGGDQAGECQRENEADPRRATLDGGVPCGGVGADADESGLAERSQAAAAGEQHETERGDRIDADVVHQRDAERAQHRWCDRHEADSKDRNGAGGAAAHTRSGIFFFFDFLLDRPFAAQRLPDQDRHERAEDKHLLERAVEKRGEAFEQPDQDGADGGRRIAHEPADDGADERLEADQEPGVIIKCGDGADEDAAQGGEHRGEQEGGRAGGRGQDADEPRGDPVDGSCAQGLAGERALEEKKQQQADDRAACDDQNGLRGHADRPEREEGARDRLGAEAFGPEQHEREPGRGKMHRHRDDQEHQYRRIGERAKGNAIEQGGDRQHDRAGERDTEPHRQVASGREPHEQRRQ